VRCKGGGEGVTGWTPWVYDATCSSELVLVMGVGSPTVPLPALHPRCNTSQCSHCSSHKYSQGAAWADAVHAACTWWLTAGIRSHVKLSPEAFVLPPCPCPYTGLPPAA
jgi:hypothetical protein